MLREFEGKLDKNIRYLYNCCYCVVYVVCNDKLFVVFYIKCFLIDFL